MDIIRLEATDSTNNWLLCHESEMKGPSMVYCHNQTAGRGQRGNSWESEPGKNITASVIFFPQNFPAFKQFLISEAVALAIVDYLEEKGVIAEVKWPNDIYVGDKKICGILVEHFVLGRNVTRSIAGFGININQTEFISDAPNPVSLKMITSKDYNIETEIERLAFIMNKYIHDLSPEAPLHDRFLKNLWRGRGIYEFFDRKNNEKIRGSICDVAPDGVLTLDTISGQKRRYYFKEVEFII